MTPSVEVGHATNQPVNSVQSWTKIGEHLERARLRIQEEITHYPPPIPACDAHFNHLLEERARIGAELNRMHEAAAESSTSADSITSIRKFVLSSNFLSEDEKQEIIANQKQVKNT